MNRFFFVQSTSLKPLNGGLVTGGDRAIRACFEVIQMDLFDDMRLLQQDFGRP
jgi:hypothetical protein